MIPRFFKGTALAGALLLLLPLTAATVAPSAQAAVFTVNTAADGVDQAPGDGTCATAAGACTLRAAIQESNALPGPDLINLPAGTYVLTLPGSSENLAASGDLDITTEIVLSGAGAASTIVDANGAVTGDRAFHVASTGVATISGITVTGGATPPTQSGGGISNGGVLTLSESVVRGNTAGAPSDTAASSGAVGGGILSSSNSTLTVINSTITGNTAYRNGGGVSFSSGPASSMTDSTIAGNTSFRNGGGIAVSSGRTASLTRVTISGNTAHRAAGGLNNSGTTTVTRSTITGNTVLGTPDDAGSGGGVQAGGTIEFIETTISRNAAAGSGGGMTVTDTVTLTRSAVTGNRAGGNGGGIATGLGNLLRITNSTISGNAAQGCGGGVSNFGSSIETSYTTLADNSAAGSACIDPLNPGGGIWTFGVASSTVGSSILAGNTIGGNCGGATAPVSSGHNLSSDASCAFNAPGDQTNIPPLLGPLQANGGPTETHALHPGSPAIDSANPLTCPAADQRGVARPQDGDGTGPVICDKGAYERETAPTPPADPLAGFHAHWACRHHQTGELRDTGVHADQPPPACRPRVGDGGDADRGAAWQLVQVLIKHE